MSTPLSFIRNCQGNAVEIGDAWSAGNFKEVGDELERLTTECSERDEKIEFLKGELNQLANFNPDWDQLQAARDSLREHMAIIRDYGWALRQIASDYTINWAPGMTHESTQRLSTIAHKALNKVTDSGSPKPDKPTSCKHGNLVGKNYRCTICKPLTDDENHAVGRVDGRESS